jgi:lipopolysaccharide/colanic/teichoic acid biosynthesis glycosyltransferase
MRILLLTQWFDPEPTFKGLLFAKELQRLGHEVEVLTGFPNYPGGKVYPGYRLRIAQREIIEGVSVLRVPLYPSHDGSAVARTWNYISFALSATIGIFGVQRPDIAYVYHPPASVALPAIALKWLRGTPFVYDIQDLWPESLSATGMIRHRGLLGLVRLWMRFVYRRAAHIVLLSRGYRDAIAREGVPAEKLSVIPNWTYEHDGPSDTAKVEGARDFEVLFAGTMGFGQALDTVLLSAKQLQDRGAAIAFTFAGGGVEVERLRSLAESMELCNISFLGRRPTTEMPALFQRADALLVHLKDNDLYAMTIPSKAQAYLLAGRPILMGVRGDAARIVEEAGAGLAFTPQDPASLTEAVLTLSGMSPEERAAMGRSGRTYYRENLALEVGAAKFVRLFEANRFSWRRRYAIKAAADAIAAALGLLLLALPMLLIGMGVALRMGRPVLFRQERPGRLGVPFRMFKFRTMTDARGPDGQLLPDRERLTRLGTWLRKTSLDELPELINVLRGEMSLVGPRPLLMRYTPYFTEEERVRLAVRPGITGLAQVSGRNLVSWDQRLALDVRYVREWSLSLDFRILMLTVLRVFSRGGVVVDAESVMRNLDDERRDRAAR